MSEVKNNSNAKVWAPPVFPMEGRLPGNVVTVTANYKKQIAEEVCYQRGVDPSGQSLGYECCHSLHISFFFDGTNNNEFNDTRKNHPSNIAKLFHASLRGRAAEKEGYFSFYMPGVGTLFSEGSIHKEYGQYPLNTYEVVYPGVHSDVGGGYPQKEPLISPQTLRSSGCMGKRSVWTFSHAA